MRALITSFVALVALSGVFASHPGRAYGREVHPRHIHPRQNAVKPLWNDEPFCGDVRKGVHDNPDFLAALAAITLTKGGPSYLKWIINEMEYPDHGKNVTRALFEIFRSAAAVQVNDNTKKYEQVVEHKWVEVRPSTDVNTERSVWWVDGFEAAAIKYLGYTHPGRTGAAVWLTDFVNRETLFESNLQQSDFWNIAKKMPSSPVVLETKTLDTMPGGLTKNHAYAVIKAYTDGSTDKIDLYDSDDGQNKTYTFSDIYGSISFMTHFTNSDELTWQFDI